MTSLRSCMIAGSQMKRRTNMKKLAFLMAITTALLTACPTTPGSSTLGTNTPPAGTIKKYGVVFLSSFVANSGFVVGNFVSYPQAIAAPTNATITADVCTVTDGSTTPGTPPSTNPPAPPAGSQQSVKISAGSPILLKKADASTLITMSENVSGTSSYSGTVATAFPAGMTLEIPGSATGFPAFTTPVPNAVTTPMQFVPASGSDVTASTTFQWTPVTGATSFVYINAKQTLAGKTITVGCLLQDDGSFSFPATTKQEMTRLGFTTGAFIPFRIVTAIVIRGDAALLIGGINLGQ
jgi:hypothetical protein